MEIIWLGHSCFRLRSEDLVVVTDPFPDSIGLKPDPRPVTAVTISNTHPNHSNWQEVVGGPPVFQSPGEYEYSGIAVRGVMTPLSQGYDLTTRNTAFCIQLDGLNICHLGDINEPLTSNEIDQLLPLDILLASIIPPHDVDRLSPTLFCVLDIDHFSLPYLADKASKDVSDTSVR